MTDDMLESAEKAEDFLVILNIASRSITGIVAKRLPDASEDVIASDNSTFCWDGADDAQRRMMLKDFVQRLSVRIERPILSAFVCISDPSLGANTSTSFVDPGQEVIFTRDDLHIALQRVQKQAIAPDRFVVHAIPQRWVMTTQRGEHEVRDPVGERGSRLFCEALLITQDQTIRNLVSQTLESIDIRLEGLIAPPIALHRGIRTALGNRNAIVIDCGATQTTIMVHRQGRLVHAMIRAFGGDNLTRALMDTFSLDWEAAESLKQKLNIGQRRSRRDVEGQNSLWDDLKDEGSNLADGALICETHLRTFFSDCVKQLSDLGHLPKSAKIHLLGRGSNLAGIDVLIASVFCLETSLGSPGVKEGISADLGGRINVGLVRAASDERERILNERKESGFGQVRDAAGNLWAWLTAPLQ